jgi:hypothetical protein
VSGYRDLHKKTIHLSIMYGTIEKLKNFKNSITGLWINPETHNKFIFSPDINDPSKGDVSIIQNGTDTAVRLDIRLNQAAEKINLQVEGVQYDVVLEEYPEQSLCIHIAPGNTIRLFKIK